MKVKISIWFVFLIGIFALFSVDSTAFSPVTMEEGEWRTIGVGTQSYNIEVLIIEDTTPATVTFKLNGQISPQLTQGATYALTGAVLEVVEIILNEAGEAGSGDIVTFTFSHYCGDHTCEGNEACGSCAADCGCQHSYLCENNNCREIVCGDHICDDNENCVDDGCCNGHEVDVYANNYNCGKCDNRCGYKEECEEGTCIVKQWCGDGICEEDEKRNCDQDCHIIQQKVQEQPLREQKREETPAIDNEIVRPPQQIDEKKEVIIMDKETSIVEKFILWLTRVFEDK